MKLKKFEGNPILSPSEKNDWESLDRKSVV